MFGKKCVTNESSKSQGCSEEPVEKKKIKKQMDFIG